MIPLIAVSVMDTAKVAASSGFFSHIGSSVAGWAVGGIAVLALPFALKYIFGTGLDKLLAYQFGKILELMEKKTEDPDVDALRHDIIMACCKFAQKKLPGEGLGAERKKLIIDFMTVRFPLLKGKEEVLSQGIDLAVAKEKALLSQIVGRG